VGVIMYDLELETNETIEITSDHGLLKKGNSNSEVSIVVTDKRFVILELPNDLEGFRFGRCINYPIKKEVILDVLLDDIVDIEHGDEYDKYTLSSTNYFYLKDDEIYNYLSNR
jgi:hypothetical protein